MRHKKVKLSAMLLLGIGLSLLQAQEAIPATGGNASGSGGMASYTVGQIVYTTNAGTDGSAAQGVQQPFEISIVTGLEEAKDITIQYIVYPNPANDYLILKIQGKVRTQCIASIYDIKGNLLENKKNIGSETIFNMSNLIPAAYLMKVSVNEKEIIIFRIVKK
jgi:hypothetical protein